MSSKLRCGIVVLALISAACGSATPSASPTASATLAPTAAPTSTAPATATPTAAATRPAGADAAGIVWLCRPGIASNPCTGDLTTTVIGGGKTTIANLQVANDPPIDCFYFYPTTSRQKSINADLSIDPEEKAVAVAQAALFSQVCNVYAPIYPQLTAAALTSGGITLDNVETAYNGVVAAFDDYLSNYNHGRGIVFIGHSQGAMLLMALLHQEVDVQPEMRKQLVSALLMGGNVTVQAGRTTGGDFSNIPACASTTQTGCVVAYSSFGETPPADAVFGRVGNALTMLQFPGTGTQQILCVNPAAPGGVATLAAYFPTADVVGKPGGPEPAPTTPYVSYTNAVTAQCKTSDGATWLQITRKVAAGSMPALVGSEGAAWGLHDLDVSLALGNLVNLVHAESSAYKP
jgi:hypothetical protein